MNTRCKKCLLLTNNGEVRRTMTSEMLKIGDAIYVTSYGVFQGLRGTIHRVHSIACTAEDEQPFLFYQVILENAHVKEPIWFQGEEVDAPGRWSNSD